MATTHEACPGPARPDLLERLITAALTVGATARVTRLIAKDDFPFGRVRDWALTRYGEHGWLTRLLECPWCVGVWISAPATYSAYRWGHRRWWRCLAGWMALSMAASAAVVLTHSDGPDVVVLDNRDDHDQDGDDEDGDQDGDGAASAGD